MNGKVSLHYRSVLNFGFFINLFINICVVKYSRLVEWSFKGRKVCRPPWRKQSIKLDIYWSCVSPAPHVPSSLDIRKVGKFSRKLRSNNDERRRLFHGVTYRCSQLEFWVLFRCFVDIVAKSGTGICSFAKASCSRCPAGRYLFICCPSRTGRGSHFRRRHSQNHSARRSRRSCGWAVAQKYLVFCYKSLKKYLCTWTQCSGSPVGSPEFQCV